MVLRYIALIALASLLSRAMAGIQAYPLDDRSVYTVRLSRSAPTTCVFPSAITGLIGSNVSAKPEDDAGVLLSHEPGSEHFSVRALKDEAKGALNVFFGGRVYALAFTTGAEAERSVIFLDEPIAGKRTRRPSIETLRALLERTKQLDRDVMLYPQLAVSAERCEPALTTHYRSFSATIESIVRFDPEDALVFRVRLKNTGDASVPYDRDSLAIRLGRDFFPAAVTDASGSIPPQATTQLYLVICGAPDGGRANLSVREKFSAIVPQP